MATLQLSIGLAIAGVVANALDIQSASAPLNYSPNVNLTTGAGLNQASVVWSDTRTLAASATENLDFAGTALTDALGVAVNLTKVKALIVVADAANTNDVIVGGHATAALSTMFGDPTDTVLVKPGGILALVAPNAAGYAVTATTADLLKMTNSAGSTGVTYTIIVVGS